MNMYTQIWNKYLPVIRILIKKSSSGQQLFDLNRIDFERAGVARKSGYKFNIEFNHGRVGNIISSSQLASDLASVLLSDAVVKDILVKGEYHITMTPKFQLLIKSLNENGQTNDDPDIVSSTSTQHPN